MDVRRINGMVVFTIIVYCTTKLLIASPAKAGTYLVHLGGVEQIRVKCLAQEHNTHNMIFFGPVQVLIRGPSAP